MKVLISLCPKCTLEWLPHFWITWDSATLEQDSSLTGRSLSHWQVLASLQRPCFSFLSFQIYAHSLCGPVKACYGHDLVWAQAQFALGAYKFNFSGVGVSVLFFGFILGPFIPYRIVKKMEQKIVKHLTGSCVCVFTNILWSLTAWG